MTHDRVPAIQPAQPEQELTIERVWKDDLDERIAAAKALRLSVKQIRQLQSEENARASALSRQEFEEDVKARTAMSKVMDEIEQLLSSSLIDHREAARMWIETTGGELSEEMIDKIERISEGTRILMDWGNRGTYVATGEIKMTLQGDALRAHASVSDANFLIPIDSNLHVGDDNIIEFFKQYAERISGAEDSWSSMQEFYSSIREAQRKGVTIPEDLSETSHQVIASLLDSDADPTTYNSAKLPSGMIASLKYDALMNRQDDNIGLLLQRIRITGSPDETLRTFQSIGEALDLAEYGDESVFVTRGFSGLSDEEEVEYIIRAQMNAFTRYQDMRDANTEDVEE